MGEQELWHYNSAEGPKGPLAQPAMADLVSDGTVGPDTLVWRQGMDAWSKASESELSGLFQAADASIPPPLPIGIVPLEPATTKDAPPVARDDAMEQKYRDIFGTTARNASLDQPSFGAPLDLAPPRNVGSGGKNRYADALAPRTMGFWQAVQRGFSGAFDFEGRASRAEYWWFQLFMVIVLIIAAGISQALLTIAVIVLIFPATAQSIRRMHDIGQSGWWTILSFVFLPFFYLLALQKSTP